MEPDQPLIPVDKLNALGISISITYTERACYGFNAGSGGLEGAMDSEETLKLSGIDDYRVGFLARFQVSFSSFASGRN